VNYLRVQPNTLKEQRSEFQTMLVSSIKNFLVLPAPSKKDLLLQVSGELVRRKDHSHIVDSNSIL
jgi:hypothetical protein